MGQRAGFSTRDLKLLMTEETIFLKEIETISGKFGKRYSLSSWFGPEADNNQMQIAIGAPIS